MRNLVLALAALTCFSAPAHAELKVIVSPDGDHRLVLANEPDDMQAELTGFAEGDVPFFDRVDCATIGTRLLPHAREAELSIEVIVARYNLINVWTSNLCPGAQPAELSAQEARAWLIEIADLRRAEDGAPFLEARDRLLEVYIFGAPGIEPDPAAAREYLAGKAARAHLAGDAAGGPRTSLYLAYMRQHGIGEPADEAGAIPFLRRAALAGSGDARALLAQASELGLGVPRDEAGALAQYGELARGVWPAVWYRLGLMLRDGRGAPADPCAARRWLERAATHSWSPIPAAREALAGVPSCPG